MKKLLFLGCFLLISACNLGVPSPTPESASQATPPPAPTAAPATQTVAPTAASTATLTPSPEPPPLYYTEEFDSASPYWQFFQTGGTSPLTSLFENGSLRVDIPTKDTWGMAANVLHSYPNVFIRAKVSASPSGSAGLICRYSETDGWFEFDANSDGTYNVLFGQWLAPDVAKYIPVINDFSNLLNGGSLNYEIGLFCQDNFLQLFVNGTMMRRVEVTNYGLTEGGVGITFASLASAPSSVSFEWVRINSE